MLESGAETSRVEETIRRAGCGLGLPVQTMVTPTGITVSVGDEEPVTRVARIYTRSVNLARVAELNSLSRDLAEGRVLLEQAEHRLQEIVQGPDPYPPWVTRLATAVAAGCFTALAGGGPAEVMAGVGAGVLVKLTLDQLSERFPAFLRLFFAAFVATLVGGFMASATGLVGSKVVIGALMPQMPGLALVAAARDLMAGELVAGTARTAEASLVALAMASGVVAGLGLVQQWFVTLPGVGL